MKVRCNECDNEFISEADDDGMAVCPDCGCTSVTFIMYVD